MTEQNLSSSPSSSINSRVEVTTLPSWKKKYFWPNKDRNQNKHQRHMQWCLCKKKKEESFDVDLLCRNQHTSLTQIKAGWYQMDAVRRTCRASVPGCCSSFTALPPAVFCPRPSCQVRFPPVRRLSWCLKSSGRALYSTAGLQKLKLDAAGEIKAQGIMIRQPDLPVTTKNATAWDMFCEKLPHSVRDL